MIAMATATKRRVEGAADETYSDVEQLVYRMTWRAIKQYGGEWEDYISLANEAFVDAYESFDPSRGAKFSTWMWWKMKGALAKVIRKSALEVQTVEPGIDLDVLPGRVGFDLRRFLFELSEDAATVVRLVVESPNEVWDILHHKDTPSCVRDGLIRQLRGRGWSVAHITKIFEEVREALALE